MRLDASSVRVIVDLSRTLLHRVCVTVKIFALLAKAKASLAARNLAWLVVERTGRLLLNVVVGFWVARYLGVASFGQLNYVLALVGLLSIFSELGLEPVVKRALLSDTEHQSGVMATAFLLRLGAGGAMFFLASLLPLMGALGGVEERLLFVLLIPMLLQPAMCIADIWLQAGLKADVAVRAQLVGLLVGALLRVLLIQLHSPLWWFAIASVAEMLVAAGGLYLGARRLGLAWHPSQAERKLAKVFLKESLPLMVAGLASVVYMRMDIVMLRAMKGSEEVGLYSAAVRFTEVWFFLPIGLASSFLPGLLAERRIGDTAYQGALGRYFDLNVTCAYLLATLSCVFAPLLIGLAYGSVFSAAVPVLRVHIWCLLFVFLGVARSQFLINEGLGLFSLAGNLIGALLNFGLNLLLIPRWGAMGAALATVFACLLSAWVVGYWHPRVRPMAGLQARALLIPFRGLSRVLRT